MKIISLKLHGLLDYATVAAFALLPTIFGLSGTPALLSYVLAVVHLIMTLLTNFPLGMLKLVPVALHRLVEIIVGPALVAAPWILGFASDMTAQRVFIGAGIAIMLVVILTRYDSAESRPQK